MSVDANLSIHMAESVALAPCGTTGLAVAVTHHEGHPPANRIRLAGNVTVNLYRHRHSEPIVLDLTALQPGQVKLELPPWLLENTQ